MDAILIALMLLLAVAASGIVLRLSPVVLPAPIVQILIGMLLAWLFHFDVRLDSEVFFLLFVPLLLFFDGWRIPKHAFFRNLRTILALAIGLVVFTVVGVGYFVHWLVPTVPLAVSFALAGVLAPTDAVAVSAVTSHKSMPARLLSIIEGEALLNDASGLVCFQFAVSAAMTGMLSLKSAALSFVALAAGGVLTGIAIALAVSYASAWVIRRAGEEPGIQILIVLLVPFGAYLAAERLGVSGILAAVAAGFTMNYADLSGTALAVTRVQRRAVAEVVRLALNGMIFVLLGQQIPMILARAPQSAARVGLSSTGALCLYAIAISLALIAIRFLWVWFSMQYGLWRARLHGMYAARTPWRTLWTVALSGIRGAITLAGILTLPIMLPNSEPFPARGFAVFTAAGVILLSLFIAAVGLPPLTGEGGSELEEQSANDESRVRAAATEAALKRIEEMRAENVADDDVDATLQSEAADRIAETYRQRLAIGHSAEEDAKHAWQLMAAQYRYQLAAIQAEREEIYRLRRSHAIDDELLRRLVQEFDLAEINLANRMRG